MTAWLGGWAKVPAWVAVDRRLTDGERVTLVYVIGRIFRESFTLSTAEVGRHRGINPEVARRHLRRLVELGYLVADSRPGRPAAYSRGPALGVPPDGLAADLGRES